MKLTQLRIVFLDVDGVLNTTHIWGRRTRDPWFSALEPSCIAALNELTRRSGALVVMSSTWRTGEGDDYWRDLGRFLAEQGVEAPLSGRTPVLGTLRGQEIDAWLRAWRESRPEPIDGFVILDDGTDMEPHMDHLVHVDRDKGLTLDDVERALEILG